MTVAFGALGARLTLWEPTRLQPVLAEALVLHLGALVAAIANDGVLGADWHEVERALRADTADPSRVFTAQQAAALHALLPLNARHAAQRDERV